jgi:tetratricopeptide (TPR) repeat protein
MPFEKAKVLKAAEKFLSQGKIDAAIKEYRQIVENDESDFTTLNMLGDLCVRAGKKDEAISCFQRIAEHYRDQEFTLKAIAMYKKVERLKPRDVEIARNLGTLYAAQGLIVDARAQYLFLADSYTRTGLTKDALEILRKIADLDPNNTDIRLKLANGYLKEKLPTEAVEAFKYAATRLYETGAFQQSLEACQKALELHPFDEEALAACVSAHVALGTAEDAAALLEKVVAERSDDQNLLEMLAGAYLAAEDPKGAEHATTMLMAQDAANYTKFIPVAQLYLKAGEIDEVARVLETIIEQMLAGREENDLLELVRAALMQRPDHVRVLRLLVRIHWWQRDMEKLRVALERLAEAAQKAEQADDERYALTQLIRLAPDDEKYTERLRELGGAQEETAEEPSFATESAPADVPSFETFAPTAETAEPAAIEFETNSASGTTFSDPSASFADLNEGFAEGNGTPVESRDLSGAVEFEFNSTAEVQPASVSAAADSDDGRRDTMMRQELESVDFYLNQGYLDIAADTLQMLEKQFGSHPEIASRRERLQTMPQATETITSFEMPAPEVEIQQPTSFEFNGSFEIAGETAVSGVTIDSGLAEVFEEFKVAAESDTSEQEDFETHYNMGTAYKEMDLLDEAIQEFQTAASLVSVGDGTPRYLQCCNMLGHCFAQKNMPRAAVLWFRKALDAPGHSEEEYLALRYELGAAYEQLGDINRAIDTFTEVYGVNISYRGVGERLQELQSRKNDSKKSRRKR